MTGTVHPDKIWRNTGARVGDVLILTKPLGTGRDGALKRQAVTEESLDTGHRLDDDAERSVLDLLTPLLAASVHAATDITGFGMLGHAMQLAQASRVTLALDVAQIPRFDVAMWALENGYHEGAPLNRDYTAAAVRYPVLVR